MLTKMVAAVWVVETLLVEILAAAVAILPTRMATVLGLFPPLQRTGAPEVSTTTMCASKSRISVHIDILPPMVMSMLLQGYRTITPFSGLIPQSPAKSVDNGHYLTEIDRSGTSCSYPVKINSQLNLFKPLHGDKDAIFSFTPADYGDSCWGVPRKKLSRRHDWTAWGWGDNYRQVSSGKDCADVELEEAVCSAVKMS